MTLICLFNKNQIKNKLKKYNVGYKTSSEFETLNYKL